MPEWLEFPDFLTIPLADWIDNVMHWVLTNWGGFFDTVGYYILQMLLVIERVLLWLPWFVSGWRKLFHSMPWRCSGTRGNCHG